MTTVTTQSQVLQFLEQHPGISYLIQDVAHEIGAENADSVGTILSKLTKNPEKSGVIRTGRALYRYIGTANAQQLNKPKRQLFEQIGQTKGGRLLLQGEDEQLYIATPLGDLLD